MSESSRGSVGVKVIVAVVVAVIGACAAVAAAGIGAIGTIPDWLKFITSVRAPVSPTATHTSFPTLMPTPSLTPTGVWPTSTHTPPPIALVIRELWATGTKCLRSGGWSADLWVRPEGGSGTYEYYVNGEWKAGPVEGGVMLSLHSNACTAIVGTMMVESGGQVKSREFFIDVPDCCD